MVSVRTALSEVLMERSSDDLMRLLKSEMTVERLLARW